MVVQTKTSYSWRMKAEQDLFEFRFSHLAVTDADAALFGRTSPG